MAERHNLTVDECLALLKDASLRPESIAEEMECAGVSRPQPTHVQSARDVLAKLHTEAVAQTAGLAGPDARALAAEIASLPEMLALALVHAAGRVARQEVLLELATSPSRMLAKESKRELQKLKQRGVQVQELRPQGEPVLKPLPEGEAPSCYASSIDAYGELAGAALFEDPLFMAWIPEEDDLRRFALRLDEIATSQLYIDAAQRRQALERAADDAALAYFTPQRRALYAKRLVEMAHVLASERRLDAARTALAVSRALGTDATNSFCRALFTHSLQGRLEPKAPPPQPSPSGLVTP